MHNKIQLSGTLGLLTLIVSIIAFGVKLPAAGIFALIVGVFAMVAVFMID